MEWAHLCDMTVEQYNELIARITAVDEQLAKDALPIRQLPAYQHILAQIRSLVESTYVQGDRMDGH